MPKLITAGADDVSSSEIVATGPIVVTVTGPLKAGEVIITADIGGGEAVAYRHLSGDPTSLARLEMPAGATFQAHLQGVNGNPGVLVNVDYIYVT